MLTLSDRAGFLIVANSIKYAVGFLMPIVLVRMLVQADYGTYQQLLVIGTAAVGMMTLGLPVSVYYFFHNVGSRGLPALIIQTSLMLAAAGIATAIIIILAALPIVTAINNVPMSNLLQVYAISIGFMIASEHSAHFMIAQDRYRFAVVFETCETCMRVVILLAPLLLGFGFTGLIWGIVVYSALRYVVRTVYLFSSSGLNFSDWSKSMFPMQQLQYGAPTVLSSVTGLMGNTFNKGIVAASFTPGDFATYSVGTLEIPLDSIFQASVANVLRASLPPLVRVGNLSEVVRIICEAVRKLSIIVLPSFIFLFVHADQFITLLFTAGYEKSVPIFQIYLWIMPLNMLILSPIPQVFGKPKFGFYINLLSMAALIVLSYVFLKLFGFYGPVLAAVAAQYFASMANILVVLRLTQTTLWKLLPWLHFVRVVVASLFGILAAYPTQSFTSSGPTNFVLAASAFGLGFLAVAAMIGVFTKEDFQLAKRWLSKCLPFKRG